MVTLVCVAACSHGTPSSTLAPTPTASVTSLHVLTNSEALIVGTSRTFQAMASMSDGTTQVVSATWSTDTPAIISMSGSTGTGMSAGMARVRATMLGQSDAQSVLVVPYLGGRWDGDFQVTACDAGPFVNTARLCVGEFTVGTWVPLSIVITQAAANVGGPVQLTAESQASGQWTSVFTGNVAGPIDANGQASFFGELDGRGPERNGMTFRVIIRSWVATLTSAGLASTWTMEFRQDGVEGYGTVTATTPGLSWTR